MQATVDRIENDSAILITRDENPERVILPVSILPPGTREGDIVTIAIERDTSSADAAKLRIAGEIDRLRKR